MAAFAAAVLIIGPDRVDRSPWYAALILLPFVAMIAAQFLAFHCPHCGARAVTGNYGYWVVSDTCNKCLRDFEGPFLSDDELAEKLIAEDKPELARRMRQERLEEEDLRKRAAHDSQAAATLERILNNRLDGVDTWVRDMRRLPHALGQAEQADVIQAEASLEELHKELAWCRSLSPRLDPTKPPN